MNKKISIRQTPGTKIQAYRLNSENDIPSFLEQYVTMDNKNIYLDFCKKTVAPLGSVIICIYLEPTLYECSLYETLPPHVFEKDGIFYKESPILQAQKKSVMSFLTLWKKQLSTITKIFLS